MTLPTWKTRFLTVALAAVTSHCAAAQAGPDEAEREIARRLRAMELATTGMDYDEYVALRRKQRELRSEMQSRNERLERQQRELESLRRQREELDRERARYDVFERSAMGAKYAEERDRERHADVVQRRIEENRRDRQRVAGRIDRVQRDTMNRLDEIGEARVRAAKELAYEMGQMGVKTGKIATTLAATGRLKRLRTYFGEIDDVAGGVDAVRDLNQKGDVEGFAAKLTQDQLEQKRDKRAEDAVPRGRLSKLFDEAVGLTEFMQDVQGLKDANQNAGKALEGFQQAGRSREEIRAAGLDELRPLRDDLRQKDDEFRRLREELELGPMGPPAPYAQQLDDLEHALDHEIEAGEAALERQRRADERALLEQKENELGRGLDAEGAALEDLRKRHDGLDVVGAAIEGAHTDDESGVNAILDEIFEEAGPSNDEKIDRMADDLFERMHGESLGAESDDADVFEDVQEILDRTGYDIDLDPDSLLDLADGGSRVGPEHVGSESAGSDFDLDESLLTDHFASVLEHAKQDTSGDDLLADFHRLVDESDVAGRIRQATADVHDRLESEIARLDERLAHDFERRRRTAAQPSFESNGKNLAEHLGELADTFNREMRNKDDILAKHGIGGLGRRWNKADTPREYQRGQAPSFGAGSFGRGSSPNGRGSIRAEHARSERESWDDVQSGESGDSGRSYEDMPSPGRPPSISAVYRASARQYRWAASQTQDPAERAKYMEAAEQSDRLADELGG